jgi:hypothetical protein
MNKTKKPHRFLKPVRPFLLIALICYSFIGFSQNKLQRKFYAQHIETVSIDGNQIFNISVSTTKTDTIVVKSILDGEYQNQYQVVIKEEGQTLKLNLGYMSFTEIPDDKRNAHKVIAATLHLEIPEQLTLNILSDVGSVALNGNFRSLFIELIQGQCRVTGKAKTATINTLDGDINVVTKSATVEASSNNGKVSLDAFSNSNTLWILKSINGDITVAKQE